MYKTSKLINQLGILAERNNLLDNLVEQDIHEIPRDGNDGNDEYYDDAAFYAFRAPYELHEQLDRGDGDGNENSALHGNGDLHDGELRVRGEYSYDVAFYVFRAPYELHELLGRGDIHGNDGDARDDGHLLVRKKSN